MKQTTFRRCLGLHFRALFALLITLGFSKAIMAQQYTVYFGTYTGPQSKGIYRSTLDAASGQLSAPELVAEAKNPTYLALSPDGRYLYAALEAGSGAVGAWSIGADGKLTALNQQPSGGDGACHVWVDATGKNVLVANYGGGSIASLPVREDGSLKEHSAFVQHTGSGPNAQRQDKPYAHAVYTDETNTFVYACDLGTDEVKIYRFDAGAGTLTPNDPPSAKVPAGGGPRHLSFHRGGFVYANNEMGMSVTAFKRDATSGALTEIQTVPTLPEGASKRGTSTAENFVHPSGKWLYVSNRGHDTIVVYSIGADGKLILVEHAPTPKEPRGFAISPDGQWLLVGGQKDNTVAVLRIDAATGKLKATGQTVEVGAPVCVLFAAKTS
ncbi:MAG TPA: lactonase family protein [Abditibacteriaceae bacterium]|jgi:6-phosphogluconolactonase